MTVVYVLYGTFPFRDKPEVLGVFSKYYKANDAKREREIFEFKDMEIKEFVLDPDDLK